MIEAPINRIKQHLREIQPATPRERGANYIDTLQLALDTLRGLMTSFNPETQYKAAVAMLDIEKTRLRHNHPLAGMETKAPIDWDEPILPLPKYDSTEPRPRPVEERIVDEIPDDNINEKQFSSEEKVEFDKMVEEAVEYFAKDDGDCVVVRCRMRKQLWGDMCDLGFENTARSFRHSMDKRKSKAYYLTPPASLLDWPVCG